MKNQKQFKLIEGTFTPQAAGKILYTMIQNKISFHNVAIMATNEKTSVEDAHSEKRVSELLEMRSSLKEQLDMANELGMKVEVHGYFEVKFVK